MRSSSASPLRAALAAVAAAAAVAGAAAAYQLGPPPDRVELCHAGPTCVDVGCHGGFGSTTTLRLELDGSPPSPLPASYAFGRAYRLLLSVSDTDATRRRFGFELAPATGCPFARRAGSLAVVDPARTQIVEAQGLAYLEHACPGIAAPTPATCGIVGPVPGSNSWIFDWLAPSRPEGDVTFFYSVNAANGDETPDGDLIYVSSASLAEPAGCPPPVARVTVARADCDPASPGLLDAEVGWDPVPGSLGETVLATSDPRDLDTLARLAPLPGPCLPAGPEPLVFVQVAGTCPGGSSGPL